MGKHYEDKKCEGCEYYKDCYDDVSLKKSNITGDWCSNDCKKYVQKRYMIIREKKGIWCCHCNKGGFFYSTGPGVTPTQRLQSFTFK